MTARVTYPALRENVVAALEALSDPVYQQTRWGRYEEGVSFFDDLTLDVNILYDDSMVLPSPEASVPGILLPSEVEPLRAVESALGPMIRDLANRPDKAYVEDPRWPTVVDAARRALAVMTSNDASEASPPAQPS